MRNRLSFPILARFVSGMAAVVFGLGLACSGQGNITTEHIARYPLDRLDEVVVRAQVALDTAITSDGGGSVRIEADSEITIPLIEVTDLGVENATLIYQARLRTEGLQGTVFLEMLCHFPGRGEFFSRDLATPIQTDVGWTTEETMFDLLPGESPDWVKLNVVIDGTGTVWVDDVRLIRGPRS